MSEASRQARWRRTTLSTYLPSPVFAGRLGISQHQIGQWAAGGSPLAGHGSEDEVWAEFLTACLEVGPDQAGELVAVDAPSVPVELSESVGALEDRLRVMDRDGRPRVGVAGDWHGNYRWAARALRTLYVEGIRTLWHLGDFGLWPSPSGAKFLRNINDLCAQLDITIHVTDGNHEDHERLARIRPVDGRRWVADRVAFFERGHRETWGGHSLVSLGGAASVDFLHRRAGVSWWPEEVTTDEDVQRAIVGGPVDILLTHDAPEPCTPGVQAVIRDNPFDFPAEALAYAAGSRRRLTSAVEVLQPRLLFHGHYHLDDHATVQIRGADHQTRVWSLDCDGNSGNLAVLDLASQEVTVLQVAGEASAW